MGGSTTGTMIVCGVLLALWFAIRGWRRHQAISSGADVDSCDDDALSIPTRKADAVSFVPGSEPARAVVADSAAPAEKRVPAPAKQPPPAVKPAHRIRASVTTRPNPVRSAPSCVDHQESSIPAFDWDDNDLDFIETSAAEQHELRTAITALTALDAASFDGDEPGRSSHVLEDVASPPAIEQDFAPSDSSKEVRSLTTTKPSLTVPAATTNGDYEPQEDRTRRGATGRATGSDVPSNKPANTAEADNERPANASPDPFQPTALEQSDFEPDVALFEPLPEDDLSGEFENIDTEIEEELEILDDLPDMWDVESDDEEADAPLYDVDVGGARLSEYDKAKRLAGQTARRFDEHADELWPVLLDIFQESPWPITQRSIERLLVAGACCEALALAADIRRIWRDHPEFGQSLPSANARGERWMYTAEAMSQLSWPRAARLADCWPSYPDAAEIECFLEDLFDRWHSNSTNQRSFTSFQLYLGYSTGYLHGTLQDWPEFCFESDDALEDSFDGLESRASWSATCEALQRYGIERPMTSRPVYIYSKAITDEKEATKA